MSTNRRHFYDFGSFRVDELERVLLRGEDVVPLTPKAFEILLVLVESSGHVLTKEQLMKRVWPDSFVEGNNLAQNISTLRKVLGGNAAKYIETIPKRGYRFVAEVREVRVEAPGPTPRERSPVADKPEPSSRFELSLDRPPETMYARSGDVNIAYQVIGDAPIDLVFVMGWVSHLEYFWREPSFARFLLRLASFARLILFDKRGTGLSD